MSTTFDTEIASLDIGGVRSEIFFSDNNGVPVAVKADFDLVVTDTNTADLVRVGLNQPHVIVPAGEACKEFSILKNLLDDFSRHGLRRDSTVVALGGGAVTDLAAFACSVYLRGVSVVLYPSSLLAMVDAAVGGKTGIDLGGFKNMVGTFYPAREIRIVPSLLESLSDREYRSGLAEVIKAALLGDPTLLELLENNTEAVIARDPSIVGEIVRRAILVKCGIVTRDFRETGERAHLNLGHTFGHALESCLGLGEWTHGEAVAWGIARAMDAGCAAGITDRRWADRVRAVLARYDYPIDVRPVTAERLSEAMQRDKKRFRDGIRFVLQTEPFTTVQTALAFDIIRDIVGGTEEGPE